MPISINDDRSPCWQDGIVGSITHTDDLCAAALALADDVAGIGIDIERISDVQDDIAAMFGEAESVFLKGLPDEERRRMTCILFSAKESYFKMQYPITGRWLEFDEAQVRILDGERFELRDLSAGGEALSAIFGHYRVQAGHVYTAVYRTRT